VFATPAVIQLQDGGGKSVARAGVTVTVSTDAPCTTLANATAQTDAAGRATFSALTLRGLVGPKTLRFEAAGLRVAVTSTTLTSTAASANDTISVRCFNAKGDGVTDDAPAIQAALNSMSDFGGTVYIPNGTYVLATAGGSLEKYPNGNPILTALLVKYRNVRVKGDSGETVLLVAAHKKLRIIAVSAAKVTLESFVVDGNKSQRDGTGGWPNADVVDGLVIGSHSDSLTISKVEARNGLEDGVGCWMCRGVVVADSYLHDNGIDGAGASGISLSANWGSRAIRNKVLRNTFGIWVAFGDSGTAVQDNVIQDHPQAGIAVGGLSNQPWGGDNRDYVISGNKIIGNGKSGYAAIDIVGSHDGVVQNNTVVDNYFGIQFSDDATLRNRNWVVQGNTCSSTIPNPRQSFGIRVLGNASNLNLVGNTCANNGRSIADQIVIVPPASVNANWQQSNVISYTP